jgi:LSD1 subclass zinc finger protein
MENPAENKSHPTIRDRSGDSKDGVRLDMASYSRSDEPSGPRSSPYSNESAIDTNDTDNNNVNQHDLDDDGAMMMTGDNSPILRPQPLLERQGSSTMQQLHQYHQQQRKQQQQQQLQQQRQQQQPLQPSRHIEENTNVDYYYPKEDSGGEKTAVVAAAVAAIAHLHRGSSDETSSRYASVTTPTQQYDSRPNLKKDSEDYSSTGNFSNDLPSYHQLQHRQHQYHHQQPQQPQQQQSQQYPYSQNLSQQHQQMFRYPQSDSGRDVEKLQQPHHRSYENQQQQQHQQQEGHSLDQERQLYQAQQLQQHRMYAPTSPLVSDTTAPRRLPQPAITDARPYPRPGPPREPTTPAAEPPIPRTKLGRRCLAQKWKRTPDKVMAELVVDGLSDEVAGRDSLVQMECASCQALLHAPRTTLLVECPKCQEVHPVVKCRLIKTPTSGVISRSTKSIPTYLY